MIGASRTPADDIANYMHVAAERKTEGRLRPDALASKVLDLYKTYLDRVTDENGPVADPGISKSDQVELADNSYYLKLVHFKSLKDSILNSTRWRKCPYCHQLKATEVDHYLPKAHFGEYAVYAPNLVPICRTCNGKKLNKYVLSGGGRRFIHPYFDKLPSPPARYLKANLLVDDSVLINFELVQPPEMTDEIWKIHCNQFAELDLAVRYVEAAVEEMASMVFALNEHYRIGGAFEVSRQLRIIQESKECIYGPNHWWPVLLDTLAASKDFCAGGFIVLDSISQ